ncbi:MAG TPA: carboxypeptidase-like regulatory domain-containing protein, partial [Acidobacteriota bacterium]|nr:carboxypeptidase-like regulatory domain-containing protein [Acidobacteriota bacterium]
MFNQLIHLAVAPKKKRLGEREKSIFSTAVFFLAFALCLFPSVAWGQAATGQLRGTVTDPSGAILAGATVTVTNQDTGVSRDVTSNESGDYLVTLLPPGTYRIEVKIEGFKQFTLDNVPVRITETTVANAKLEVGAGTSEIITVTSETPLVRTDSATGGRVIEERSLRQLPLPT